MTTIATATYQPMPAAEFAQFLTGKDRHAISPLLLESGPIHFDSNSTSCMKTDRIMFTSTQKLHEIMRCCIFPDMLLRNLEASPLNLPVSFSAPENRSLPDVPADKFSAFSPLFHTYYYIGSTPATPNEDFRFNVGVEDQGIENSSLMRINASATLRLHLWCSKAWMEKKYVRAYVFNFIGKPFAAIFDAAANVALLVIKICAAIFILIGKKILKAWNPSMKETSSSIRLNLHYQMVATGTSLAYFIFQFVTQTSANWISLL